MMIFNINILNSYNIQHTLHMSKFVSYAEIKKVYGVSPQTLRNWAAQHLIDYRTIQHPGRKTWLYDIESIGKHINGVRSEPVGSETKAGVLRSRTVLYCRVSTAKQSADLERQSDLLQKSFPNGEIIKDIGSGVNFHRPGLTRLVRRICRGKVSEIVVTYRDRIARFGYELFKLVCDQHACKIVVLSEGEETVTEDDLQHDLFSVISLFVSSANGKRSAFFRKFGDGTRSNPNSSDQSHGGNQGATVSDE